MLASPLPACSHALCEIIASGVGTDGCGGQSGSHIGRKMAKAVGSESEIPILLSLPTDASQPFDRIAAETLESVFDVTRATVPASLRSTHRLTPGTKDTEKYSASWLKRASTLPDPLPAPITDEDRPAAAALWP
jgi:hypothetical protein